MNVEEALRWQAIERETETMKRIVRRLQKLGSDLALLGPILNHDKYRDNELDELFMTLVHDTPKSEERELCIQCVDALQRVPFGDYPGRETTNYRAVVLQMLPRKGE